MDKMEKEALKAVVEGRVIKVVFEPSGEVLWLVYGRKFKNLYIVIPGLYCSCKGFTMNVILRRISKYCYHIRARDIAEEKGVYVERRLKDRDKPAFLRKIFSKMLTT